MWSGFQALSSPWLCKSIAYSNTLSAPVSPHGISQQGICISAARYYPCAGHACRHIMINKLQPRTSLNAHFAYNQTAHTLPQKTQACTGIWRLTAIQKSILTRNRAWDIDQAGLESHPRRFLGWPVQWRRPMMIVYPSPADSQRLRLLDTCCSGKAEK